MSLRPLKILTAILGVVPFTTGMVAMLGIAAPPYADLDLPRSALLDSNLRFFGGLWFGVGLAAFWLAPRLERQAVLFRVLWAMIFIGGFGRLLSIVMVGLPPWPELVFMALELVGAPVLVLWHGHVVKSSRAAVEGRQQAA